VTEHGQTARLQPQHLGVAAAALAAAVATVVVTADRGALPLLLVLGLLGLASFAYLAWNVDPAWTLTASILLSIFGAYWGQLGPLGYFPVTPDRMLLVAGVLALALRAPGARDRDRGALRIEPVHVLLGVTLAFAVVSGLASETFLSNSGFFRLFDRFGIAPFLMFTIAPLAFPTARHRRIFLAALAALGAYLGLTALFEAAGPRALVFPSYIVNPDLGYHLGRARGPFLEAEANGIALFVCGIAAIVASITWRDRPLVRMLCWLIAALALAGCLYTLSRAVWLGAGVAAVLTLLAFRQLRPLLVPAVIGLVAMVGLSLALIPGLAASVNERKNDESSLWDRENLNSAAMRAVEDKPLLGVGWGRFTSVGDTYFWQSADRPLTAVGPQSCDSLPASARQRNDGTRPPCTIPVHNAYLSNAAELGLIGVTLWIAATLAGIGGAIVGRGPPELWSWRAGLFAIAVMSSIVIFFTPLEGPFSPVVLWTWAGILWGTRYQQGGEA
jgi:O-antigen ligase